MRVAFVRMYLFTGECDYLGAWYIELLFYCYSRTDYSTALLITKLISKQVKVTLRLTVSQSVSKSWCQNPSGAHDQIFITVWQLRSCSCVAPSLTRWRVCLFYVLLALASAIFLGSESLGTWDHILLSQIWDFRFRRLLRLAGSRWRYSTTPPHGELVNSYLYLIFTITLRKPKK
jgi:hypothetical protein